VNETDVSVSIGCLGKIERAALVDLTERYIADLAVNGNAVSMTVPAYGLCTIGLDLQSV